MDDFATYPSGLRLGGRRVVVVGGGHVAQRRVPGLIAVGADVLVVSPEVTPAIEGLVGGGEITWAPRRFREDDLDGAWYAVAATDDAAANAAVGRAAEERRVFCVRADDATEATAWTPAVGRHAGMTVAVLAQPRPAALGLGARRDPRADARGRIVARDQRQRAAGVVLVGGGPGDPELISRRRPAGADGGGRRGGRPAGAARAARRAAGDVELIDVAKLPRGRSAQQEEINRVIVDRALAGQARGALQGR